MGGLDPAKLLVILVLALVLLGPDRLPRAPRQVGAFWREFTQFRVRLEDEVRGAIPDVDLPKIPVIPKSGLTGYLTGMMRDADRSRGSTAVGGATDDDEPGDEGFRERSEPVAVPWLGSDVGDFGPSSNPSPVIAPNGIPAGWHARGAEAPGYASGSLLSPLPSGAPEGLLGAEIPMDLDDPSWN